jgi:lytic murein transglycosylase
MTALRPVFLMALAVATAGAPAFAQQPECGTDFETWRAALAEEARSAGVGEKGLTALADTDIDTRVLARDRGQVVFTQVFNEFAGRMISDYRLKQGAANLKKYADVFERARAEYGVQPAVIAAFWALETDFGAVQGDFGTLAALVTLAHDCRRPELFRPQIVPLLTLIDRGDLPADVKGAWAGEVGQTQMLPSDILLRGIDGDGDGHVDVRGSAPDVIMTTANKINHRGWKPNQPWLLEVRVPDELPWEQTGRTNRLPISQWSEWGVTDRDGNPLPDEGLAAGLVLPMGRKGPAFLAYENFDVYLQWNQSAIYALTAGVLATRLDGAPPYDKRDPEPGLVGDAMKDLQQRLAAKGYDVGRIDGILGVNTREAVRQEQMRLGLPVDGWPTPALLGMM